MAWIYLKRYNINNERMHLVTCVNCGNQLEADPDDLNVFDLLQVCCKFPDYFWSIHL